MTPVYISHSFHQTDAYQKAIQMIEENGGDIRNMTVPIWKQLPGDANEVREGIRERIRQASRVVVLVTEEARESEWVQFEIECAKEFNKPLIALREQGDATEPIPAALHDGLYRVVGWRGAALVKAIRGEYPPDSRVYKVTEEEERKALVARVAAGVGSFSILLLATADRWLPALQASLRPLGVEVRPDGEAPAVGATALKGALIGGLGGLGLGLLLGLEENDLALFTLGGAGTGALVAAARRFRVQVRGRGPVIEAHFEQMPECSV